MLLLRIWMLEKRPNMLPKRCRHGGLQGASRRLSGLNDFNLQHFITLMDSLKLNMTAVDQIHPLLSDLMQSLAKVHGLPADFQGKERIKNWYMMALLLFGISSQGSFSLGWLHWTRWKPVKKSIKNRQDNSCSIWRRPTLNSIVIYRIVHRYPIVNEFIQYAPPTQI